MSTPRQKPQRPRSLLGQVFDVVTTNTFFVTLVVTLVLLVLWSVGAVPFHG